MFGQATHDGAELFAFGLRRFNGRSLEYPLLYHPFNRGFPLIGKGMKLFVDRRWALNGQYSHHQSSFFAKPVRLNDTASCSIRAFSARYLLPTSRNAALRGARCLQGQPW